THAATHAAETWTSVSTYLASFIGCRTVQGNTTVPRRIYFVRDPHDPHSFPTRRSSDLWRPPPRSCTTRQCVSTRRITTTSVRNRSEEHTSELQSRGHLVCRLLLEKKKPPCKS